MYSLSVCSCYSGQPLNFPRLDVSYKELMLRVKKAPPKLDLALSAYPNEVHHPEGPFSVISSPTEESHAFTKEMVSSVAAAVVPRKLNKIEQAREALIQWIFDCTTFPLRKSEKIRQEEA